MPTPEDSIFFIVVFAGVLYSIVLHEGAHAVTALWCGDNTAKRMGRITLNPIPSIDPIGTLLLPLLAVFLNFPCIGWAKPVPVDPSRFRRRVLGDVIVSMAGIVVNLLLAFIFCCLWTLESSSSPDTQKTKVLALLAINNVALALFNLIPFPPLDGHHVMKYVLPREWRDGFQRIGFAGIVIVYLLLRIPEVKAWYNGVFVDVLAALERGARAVVGSF